MFSTLVYGLGRCIQHIYRALVAIEEVPLRRSGPQLFKQFLNLYDLNSNYLHNSEILTATDLNSFQPASD